MTGVLNVDTIADNAGTGPVTLTKQEALKSWCLWEQDSTQAGADSLNVASISDIGTGYTRQTFTNNFSTINYAPILNTVHDSGSYVNEGATSHDDPPTTSTFRADYLTTASAAADTELCASHIVGDLA